MVGRDIRYGLFSWLLILITSLVQSCDNQSTIEPRMEDTFIKLYGRENNDEAVDMLRLEDGRLVILGTSSERLPQEGQQAPRDVLIIVTDELGNNSEYFLYEGDTFDTDEVPSSMILVGQDIFFSGTQYIGGQSDMMAGRFSLSSMSYEWFESYPLPGNEEGLDLDVVEGQNTLTIAGNKNEDIAIRLIDFQGTPLSNDVIGATTENGVITNILNTGGSEYSSYVYFELDAKRIITETLTFDGIPESTEYGTQGEQTPVDVLWFESIRQILTLGYVGSKSDPEAIIIHTFQLSGSLPTHFGENRNESLQGIIPRSILQSYDGDFIILGKDVSAAPGEKSILLIKVRFSSGGPGTVNGIEVIWQKRFGTGIPADSPGGIVEDEEGNILFSSTVSFDEGGARTKIAIYKTDSEGNLDF